jgi:PIN domain nuclease of toxin-antitoxin system
MNLLLDTHAWLWFFLGHPRLSATARRHIEDPSNVKFVSAASYWEISLKISLGKYTLNVPYATFVRQSIEGQGFRVLHISPRHTEQVSTLPFPLVGGKEHRDPFDRLLVAQAVVSGMSIVSDDGKFGPYGVPIIW